MNEGMKEYAFALVFVPSLNQFETIDCYGARFLEKSLNERIK